MGTNGFGYDPIFLHPGLGRTFGLATKGEKDALSHRGQAVTALRAYLEKAFEKE
jgi:XTP/dITP diphosphohydrolase